ncbi:TPA: hypothetical protein ACXM9A_003064, partial [Pseudomonas aeruginosa]
TDHSLSAQEELSERKEEKTPSPRVNNRAAKTFRLISEEGKYKKKNSDEPLSNSNWNMRCWSCQFGETP